MAWYLNTYHCSDCGIEWGGEWSCACDDECPCCGCSDLSPIKSDDISAYIEIASDGLYDVFYSPPEAAHFPEYVLMARVTNSKLAQLIENVAFEVSKPT